MVCKDLIHSLFIRGPCILSSHPTANCWYSEDETSDYSYEDQNLNHGFPSILSY